MLRLLALLAILATPTLAREEIVLGLSQDAVSITATFQGSEILVFGAIRREGPLPVGVIQSAPSFYAVATSAPLTKILRPSEDLTNRISIPLAVRQVGTNVLDSRSFARALMRIREENSLYQTLEGTVDVTRDTLFNTSITMPANLTEGFYVARIFLTRDGNVVDTFTTSIPVRKVGLERWLYNLSRENAVLYGLMSLAIAIASGWLASCKSSTVNVPVGRAKRLRTTQRSCVSARVIAT